MKYKGFLNIDLDEGIATFTAEDSEGRQHQMLRVTHLPKPIPIDFSIDVVAIRNVTSYTPLQEVKLREKSGLTEWMEPQ